MTCSGYIKLIEIFIIFNDVYHFKLMNHPFSCFFHLSYFVIKFNCSRIENLLHVMQSVNRQLPQVIHWLYIRLYTDYTLCSQSQFEDLVREDGLDKSMMLKNGDIRKPATIYAMERWSYTCYRNVIVTFGRENTNGWRTLSWPLVIIVKRGQDSGPDGTR